jgi:hypothetical protein
MCLGLVELTTTTVLPERDMCLGLVELTTTTVLPERDIRDDSRVKSSNVASTRHSSP